MMPYAVDQHGRPVFFISSMAMHTQNLCDDPRASLLVTQPDVSGDPLGAARNVRLRNEQADVSGDPLGAARVTLIGTAAVASAAEVRELYLPRYENAKVWQEYSDFAYRSEEHT